MSIFADGEAEAQRGDLGGHTVSGRAGIVTWICLVIKGPVPSRALPLPRFFTCGSFRQCPQLISRHEVG